MLDSYRARYGKEPPNYALYGVAATQVILAAIEASDGTRKGVRDAVFADDGITVPADISVLGKDIHIDARTGEDITSFGDNGKVDIRVGLEGDISSIRALQTSNPGRVFEDLIIISLPASGASYDSRPADIHAYNIMTGELAWQFHTVPRAGEFGADTWPAEGLGRYGGVHNWSESTVDSELGIVFIPTGTARYDFYGANRHGENLFGNSLLALDARTGERLWHFQTIHMISGITICQRHRNC